MRRRHEVVFEGNSWTVGTGGLSLRGYASLRDALAAAMESAHEAEELGEHIAIFLWQHGQETQVYQSPTR